MGDMDADEIAGAALTPELEEARRARRPVRELKGDIVDWRVRGTDRRVWVACWIEQLL